MDFIKTVTNKGVVCILFKEQKYRLLREMASGNVSLRCTKKKCSARIEMDKSMLAIEDPGGNNETSPYFGKNYFFG